MTCSLRESAVPPARLRLVSRLALADDMWAKWPETLRGESTAMQYVLPQALSSLTRFMAAVGVLYSVNGPCDSLPAIFSGFALLQGTGPQISSPLTRPMMGGQSAGYYKSIWQLLTVYGNYWQCMAQLRAERLPEEWLLWTWGLRVASITNSLSISLENSTRGPPWSGHQPAVRNSWVGLAQNTEVPSWGLGDTVLVGDSRPLELFKCFQLLL